MSYIDINAYNCTCERCDHTWSTFKLPLTCAKCRSPYWDVPKGAIKKPVAEKKQVIEMPDLAVPRGGVMYLAEKKSAEASPDKKETIGGLQALINSIQEKSNEKTKSVIDTWPSKPIEDQPSYEEFNVIKRD